MSTVFISLPPLPLHILYEREDPCSVAHVHVFGVALLGLDNLSGCSSLDQTDSSPLKSQWLLIALH